MTRPEIDAFWRWWADARHRIEEAIDSGVWGTLPDELTEVTLDIHPDLEWELSSGTASRHALCVTSGGVRELRSLAERWRQAGPPADATWEYHAARPPDLNAFEGGTTLQLAGQFVDPAAARLVIDVDAERQLIDVTLHHPAFADMPRPAQAQVGFLVLDWLLGEDGVDRWLGAVDVAEQLPDGAVAPLALPEAVAELDRVSEPHGAWALLQGTDPDGWPVLITARQPLPRSAFPLFDLRGSVTVAYRQQPETGFPEPEELDRLAALEDELVEAVGPEAVLAAVVSRRGERTFHFYADADGPAPTLVEAWSTLAAGGESQEGVVVVWEPDPAWSEVRRFA
ncbi:MAG: DUF695 domain-containing protein [Acidimicrobiia bacterium]|nr:DUF695 domain-containing protein [Acidimicrobiia bacterium]